MEVMLVNTAAKTIMEFTQSSDNNPSPPPSRKIERKVIEKNRRNHMKSLYSKLYSLISNDSCKESQLPLPDQVDEAINYIKTLEARLKKSKEKKESLIGRKRSYSTCSDYNEESTSSIRSSQAPQLEIKESGSAVEIVLITGLDNRSLFCEIVRIISEESKEILNASFSVVGNSIFHVVHAQMRDDSVFGFGAAKVTDRLNRFINGSTSEIEIGSELWDFEIDPELWRF